MKAGKRLLRVVERLSKVAARLSKAVARLLKVAARLLKAVARLLKVAARLLKAVAALCGCIRDQRRGRRNRGMVDRDTPCAMGAITPKAHNQARSARFG